MKQFIVVSHHKAEDCIVALKQVLATGYLTHFDWGCKDGVHTGWAILEAETREEAMMSVPAFLRNQAQVVRLTKFNADQVERMHPKEELIRGS
jgi:hypothetical protein